MQWCENGSTVPLVGLEWFHFICIFLTRIGFRNCSQVGRIFESIGAQELKIYENIREYKVLFYICELSRRVFIFLILAKSGLMSHEFKSNQI